MNRPSHNFKTGDTVKTPSGRRAMLLELPYDGRWLCRYLDGDNSLVSLYPKLLRPE